MSGAVWGSQHRVGCDAVWGSGSGQWSVVNNGHLVMTPSEVLRFKIAMEAVRTANEPCTVDQSQSNSADESQGDVQSECSAGASASQQELNNSHSKSTTGATGWLTTGATGVTGATGATGWTAQSCETTQQNKSGSNPVKYSDVIFTRPSASNVQQDRMSTPLVMGPSRSQAPPRPVSGPRLLSAFRPHNGRHAIALHNRIMNPTRGRGVPGGYTGFRLHNMAEDPVFEVENKSLQKAKAKAKNKSKEASNHISNVASSENVTSKKPSNHSLGSKKGVSKSASGHASIPPSHNSPATRSKRASQGSFPSLPPSSIPWPRHEPVNPSMNGSKPPSQHPSMPPSQHGSMPPSQHGSIPPSQHGSRRTSIQTSNRVSYGPSQTAYIPPSHPTSVPASQVKSSFPSWSSKPPSVAPSINASMFQSFPSSQPPSRPPSRPPSQAGSRRPSQTTLAYPTSYATSDPYALTKSSAPCGDPYNFAQEEILFVAEACLIQIDQRTKGFKKMYKGVLKLIRGPGDQYIIKLENMGYICMHTVLTLDSNIQPSCLTQFGFTFYAPDLCVRKSEMNQYLLSFRNRSPYDEFMQVSGHVMYYLRGEKWEDEQNQGESPCCFQNFCDLAGDAHAWPCNHTPLAQMYQCEGGTELYCSPITRIGGCSTCTRN